MLICVELSGSLSIFDSLSSNKNISWAATLEQFALDMTDSLSVQPNSGMERSSQAHPRGDKK